MTTFLPFQASVFTFAAVKMHREISLTFGSSEGIGTDGHRTQSAKQAQECSER